MLQCDAQTAMKVFIYADSFIGCSFCHQSKSSHWQYLATDTLFVSKFYLRLVLLVGCMRLICGR